MAGWTGKKVNVSYVRTNEPSFLKQFKERVGYKEGNGIQNKFQEMPLATEDELADNDDERPQIVCLGKGDLTQEEFDKLQSGTNPKELSANSNEHVDDDEVPEDGKVLFRKPTKRSSDDKSELKTSSSKKSKKSKKDKGDKGKAISNKKLLSFDEDEDDEG